MKAVDSRILSLLSKSNDGMMIIEIAAAIKRTRHTAGRYLDRLVAEGKVEMRKVGVSKIYKIKSVKKT
ncbi:hypothetical protein ACFL6S_00760 [Candidatus Poribacteria bacterium]